MHTHESILKGMTKGPVIIEGLPDDIYHSFFAMSASGLKNFEKCPGYWFWKRNNPSADTSSRKFGRNVHIALGEPERFNTQFEVVDGHRGGKAVKEAIEFAESQGKIVVKSEEYQLLKDVAKYCREEHDLLPAVFKTGTGERSIFWLENIVNPTTGKTVPVPCKARLDWTSGNGIIFDWKTFDEIQDAINVGRQIAKMKYHVQESWYSRAYGAAYSKKPHSFNFVFIETEEGPESNWIDVAVRDLSSDLHKSTSIRIDYYLEIFANCIATNTWPRTPPLVLTAEADKFVN